MKTYLRRLLSLRLVAASVASVCMTSVAQAQPAPALAPAQAVPPPPSPAEENPVATEATPAAAPTVTAPPEAGIGPAASVKATEPSPTAFTDPEGAFSAGGSDSGEMIGEEGPKLEFYGFSDFSYSHILNPPDNLARQILAPYPTFYVGHLNLYMSASHGDDWRSLAEVRFTYSPLGDETLGGSDGVFPEKQTTTADYAEGQRIFEWGGIEIQRAWIEYQPYDFLTLRAGAWYTPYGYWNDDHGSPTIITVHRPFPIGDQIFPEKQTGLVAHGKYFIDATTLGYFLTLSNGRGPYDLVRDLDNNKAVGGRLYVETTAIGNLTIGVDAYRGRYTRSTKRYRVDSSSGEPNLKIFRTIDTAYEELSLGIDFRLTWKGLHVQGELMLNDGAFDDGYRDEARAFDPRPAFAADYRRVGAYGLVGYREPWLKLMPYAMVEHASFTNDSFAPPVIAWTTGLNLRPTPSVVLKAEVVFAQFDGVGTTGFGDDVRNFGAQVAWAF